MSLWSRVITLIKVKLSNSDNPRKALSENIESMSNSMQELGLLIKRLKGLKIKLSNKAQELEEASLEFYQEAKEAYNINEKKRAEMVLREKYHTLAFKKELENTIDRIDQRLEPLNRSLESLKNRLKIYKTRKEVLELLYDASRTELSHQEIRMGISNEVPMDIYTALKRSEEEIKEVQEKVEATKELLNEDIFHRGITAISGSEDETLFDITKEMKKLEREAREKEKIN